MKFIVVLAIAFSFLQCGSNTIVKNATFKVEKAFYNNWVGGQPGVSGTKVEIHLKEASKFVFEALYFNGKRAKVEVAQKETLTQIIAHFSTSKRINSNLILDLDATKELENTVPNLEKFPFKLKENEAILSYRKGKKIVYFKIENIKKIKLIPFPSVNRN